MAPVNFLKQVFSEFGRDKVGQMSAAFAYIAVFSIGPLLLVLISITGFIFGHQAVEGQLSSHLNDILGPKAANSLQNVIAHTQQSGGGIIALIIGVVGTLLGATGLTNQLQNSFNTVFGAVPDPKAGFKQMIYSKVKNIALIGLAGLAVVASVIVSALVNGLGHKVNEHLGIPAFGLELINTAISLVVFIGILYLIYRFLPDVIIPRKLTLAAAAVVSLLFLAGKIVLGIIIGHNGTASAYGAAASLVVLLLWFYYTAQILILGAEGIKVYGLNHQLEFPAKRYALKRKSLDIHIKRDLRGRFAEAFVRGFKKRTKN